MPPDRVVSLETSILLVPVVTVSVELSARRTVNPVGVPLKFDTGTKRRLSAAATYNPLLVDTVPTSVHVLLLRYCQLPSVLALALLPTITTPAKLFALEPLETVSVVSLNAATKSVLTLLPELVIAGLLTEVA